MVCVVCVLMNECLRCWGFSFHHCLLATDSRFVSCLLSVNIDDLE